MTSPTGAEVAGDPLVNASGHPHLDATGDSRVDRAVQRLDGLGDVPVAEHVEVFERVHSDLQDTLNTVEQD